MNFPSALHVCRALPLKSNILIMGKVENQQKKNVRDSAKPRILLRCSISKLFLVLVISVLRIPPTHSKIDWILEKRKVEYSLFKTSNLQKCGDRYFRDRIVTPEIGSLRVVMTSRTQNDKGREGNFLKNQRNLFEQLEKSHNSPNLHQHLMGHAERDLQV